VWIVAIVIAERAPGDRQGRCLHGGLQRTQRWATALGLYEFTPETAFGVAIEKPFGATRWRFDF
jgi:hypothetical protein